MYYPLSEWHEEAPSHEKLNHEDLEDPKGVSSPRSPSEN
jgi:hypothetical protein